MWVAFGLDLKKWYAFPWEASKVGDMGRENVTRKALSAWCLKFSLGWGISNAWSRYTGQDMAVGRGRLELPGKYDLGEGSWEDGSWRRNTQGNKRQRDLGRNKGREEADVPRRLHDREGNEPLRESSGRGWEKGEMARLDCSQWDPEGKAALQGGSDTEIWAMGGTVAFFAGRVCWGDTMFGSGGGEWWITFWISQQRPVGLGDTVSGGAREVGLTFLHLWVPSSDAGVGVSSMTV